MNEQKSAEYYQRFREVTEKEVNDIKDVIYQRETLISECKGLCERLEELPKRLEHKILAPVCAVGYFPAKIVRSNEVNFLNFQPIFSSFLVLMSIGDDYFVECSTFTAQIVLRKRIEEYEKNVEKGRNSIKLRQDKLDYFEKMFKEGAANQTSDEVEINEPYDEKAEEEFRKKRKERAEKKSFERLHKLQKDVVKDFVSPVDFQAKPIAPVEKVAVQKYAVEPPECRSDEEVFRRLEQLEVQEIKGKELEVPEDDQELPKLEKEDMEKHRQRIKSIPGVSPEEYKLYMDILDSIDSSEGDDSSSSDEREDSEELDSDDLSEPEIAEKKIVKKEKKVVAEHGKVVEVEESTQALSRIEKEKSAQNSNDSKPKRRLSVRFAEKLEESRIISEIVEKPQDSTPKSPTTSILRPTAATPVDREAVERADRITEGARKIVKGSVSAFPGAVVERDPTGHLSKDSSKPSEPAEPRVSKFKQSRLRR
ncbi:unnamed protein product [Caenorhabditis auriculariae]|uniref:Uncharacterized protein n=1 Tax=Caenorhabditis auriculariae TaxID=2777116 RepID=A0A8S1GZB1_9PELO|nr:unnamed protein product [Caenorhabditis auriculariae]